MKKVLLFVFLFSGSMQAFNISGVKPQDPQTAQSARERLKKDVAKAVWADKWIIPVGAVVGAGCFILRDPNPYNLVQPLFVSGIFAATTCYALLVTHSSIEARKDYWKVLEYCAKSENQDFKQVAKEANVLRKLHMSTLGMIPPYVLTAALAVGIANVPVKQ